MKLNQLKALLVLVASPLALFASPEMDRKIEDAAKASYNYRTVLSGNVTVKAVDGVVTLSGKVLDKDDKALAADTVENLPGVVSVKNEIVVEPAFSERSDDWMALKIRSRLLVKAHVSAANTQVAVKDGVVTLTGSAENIAQKELTAAYAKDIEGVRSVENNILVSAKSSEEGEVREMIDDASITSQVKFALLSHKSTSVLGTKVTTNDGVVVLSGEVGSDAEKSLVKKLAQDVRGVKSVTNNLTVRS